MIRWKMGVRGNNRIEEGYDKVKGRVGGKK